MPRPKRTRQASKPAAEKQAQDEEPQQTQAPSRRTRSARISAAQQQAIESANVTRDAALDRLATEDPTTTTGGDDTSDPVEIGRRAATPERRDTTGLDLGDDMFSDLDESFQNIKVPGSDRSADYSSIYGGSSHMKPRSRSRQSSIIGRNDPPIRPSSRGGTTPLMSSTFNIGAFRRRAREPSILGTAQKSKGDITTTTAQDVASENSDEEGEDFAPEAESTPVNNRRKTRASLLVQEPEKEQEREREGSPSLPDLPGARKRKSDGVSVEDERPSKASRVEEDQVEMPSDSDSDSELSSLDSPVHNLRPRMTLERPVTPNQEEYAAPPASSGSESEGEFWPDIHGLARKRRRPSVHEAEDDDALSDASSPPSLTHSPNYHAKSTRARGRSRTRRPSPPPLSTADLANLLPKRRVRRNDMDVEYDTTGLTRDQDELSFARSTRRRPSANPKASAKNKAGKEAPASNTRSASRRNGRTYGHRSSNKENEGDDDEEDGENEESMFEPHVDESFADGGDSEPFVVTEELRNAAKKFEEIDRFEMSFEEEEEPELLEAR